MDFDFHYGGHGLWTDHSLWRTRLSRSITRRKRVISSLSPRLSALNSVYDWLHVSLFRHLFLVTCWVPYQSIEVPYQSGQGSEFRSGPKWPRVWVQFRTEVAEGLSWVSYPLSKNALCMHVSVDFLIKLNTRPTSPAWLGSSLSFPVDRTAQSHSNYLNPVNGEIMGSIGHSSFFFEIILSWFHVG